MTGPRGSNRDKRVKHWNDLTSSTNAFQVDSIRIIESNVFAPQSIELHRAIAFVGLHGTGKSLLLRMIEAAFGHVSPYYTPPFLPGASSPNSHTPRLTGVMDVTLRTPAGLISHTVDLSQSEKERAKVWKQDRGAFDAWYIDSYGGLGWLTYMYENYDFTSPFSSSDSEYDLSREDRDELRRILGRPYDRISMRSAFIDDGIGDNLHLPFISAELGTKAFDNTAMSQGELWVHYIHWFLRHEVNMGGLVLLDEPEAFIAARGRRPFIDHIAHQALRRRLQLMVGTHSPEVLSRFPLANIRMCIPCDDGIQIRMPKDLFQIREYIGIETPIRGLVLVEDKLAQQLLSYIFQRHDNALTREIDIVIAGSGGGESNVIKALELLKPVNRLVCLGVLDADQRHKTSGSSDESQGVIYILPGDMSPERELLANALIEAQWIANVMGVRVDDINCS